jgi:hypothetical protein
MSLAPDAANVVILVDNRCKQDISADRGVSFEYFYARAKFGSDGGETIIVIRGPPIDVGTGRVGMLDAKVYVAGCCVVATHSASVEVHGCACRRRCPVGQFAGKLGEFGGDDKWRWRLTHRSEPVVAQAPSARLRTLAIILRASRPR